MIFVALYCSVLLINNCVPLIYFKQEFDDSKAIEDGFADLKKAGMIKWQTLLANFINNRLGIQIPSPGKEKIPDTPLLKIVEEGGNFGHHASGRGKAMEKSVAGRKLDTVKRLVRKLPFSLRYAPKETLRTIVSLTVGNFKKNA